MQRQSIEALYLKWAAFINASPKTVESYTRAVRVFVNYCKDNNLDSLDLIGRNEIVQYKMYLAKTHKPATVNAYLAGVRELYKWLSIEGIIDKDIAKTVKGEKTSREHKKEYLTVKQIKALLDTCDTSTEAGQRDYAILTLMITGGLRTIEVIRADVGDLKTYGDNTALFVQGKGRTEKNDAVIISAEQERILREYIAARKASPQEPLFISQSNRNGNGRLTTRSISRLVKEHLIQAGIDDERYTAHSLRHTAITQALIGGASLQEAQQFARHIDINTTLIYAHNLDKQNNKCSRIITGAIF